MMRLACFNDLPRLEVLGHLARKRMKETNVLQWTGDYPSKQDFEKDILAQALYVLDIDQQVIGCVAMYPDTEVAYREVSWTNDQALVMHRVIVDTAFQGKGYGKALFSFAIEQSKVKGVKSLKVDTHPDNLTMQGLIKSMGFHYVGYLTSINRNAYELIL